MMRVNQQSSSVFQAAQKQQNIRSNDNSTQSFGSFLQAQEQQMMPQGMPPMPPSSDEDTESTTIDSISAPYRVSGFNGPAMPPMMEMDGEPPALPNGIEPVDGEEPPELPDGTAGQMPDSLPELPDGEEHPEKPDGVAPVDGDTDDLPEVPAGEEPPAKPDESDSGMSQPPFGMSGMNRLGGMGGMQGGQRPGGSISGMNGMDSFKATSFMNRA